VSVTFIFPINNLVWTDFNSEILKRIPGSQDTDMPGLSPSTSQPEFAVPNDPTSEIVEDRRDHDVLNKQINDRFPSTGDTMAMCEGLLPSLLVNIARQNNITINIGTADNMIEEQYKWLREFLIEKWRGKSFTKVRRLSECPLCIFPMDKFT